MNKRNWIIRIFFLILLTVCFGAFHFREKILTHLLTQSLNRSLANSLAEPLTLERVYLDSHFQIHLSHLALKLKTKKEAVPLQIESADFQGSLLDLLMGKTVLLEINNIVIANSPRQGFQVKALIQSGKNWQTEFRGDLRALDLENIVWLDPDHLKGSSGRISGLIQGSVSAANGLSFSTDLKVSEPGGKVQAEFFDLLSPYLPRTSKDKTLTQIVEGKRVVRYSRAALRLHTLKADTLKGVFRILIPEYNVDLNVNLVVHLDKNNAFAELAELLGQIEVRA